MHKKSALKRGAKVSPGTYIGTFGNTGNSQGSHVHSDIEVSRFNWSEYFITPALKTGAYNWKTQYLKKYSVKVKKDKKTNLTIYRMYPETFYAGMNAK